MPISKAQQRRYHLLQGILNAIADDPKTADLFAAYEDLYVPGMDADERWTWERSRVRDFVRQFNMPIDLVDCQLLANALLDRFERRAMARAGEPLPKPEYVDPGTVIGRRFVFEISEYDQVEDVKKRLDPPPKLADNPLTLPGFTKQITDYLRTLEEAKEKNQQPIERSDRKTESYAEQTRRDGRWLFLVSSGRQNVKDLATEWHHDQVRQHWEKTGSEICCENCVITVRRGIRIAKNILKSSE